MERREFFPLDQLLDTVFHADIMDVIRRIPDATVDCIFADPDYNVGVKYNNQTYRKAFEEYIDWCIGWAKESHRVLKDTGNFFIINYPRNNAYLRVRYLDEAFYEVHDYCWVYNTNVGHSRNKFTTAHRSILHCTKSKHNKFFKEHVAQPFQNPTDRRIRQLIRSGSKGRMPYSWLYFDLVKNVSREKTFHSCQIPQRLSETLIASCTEPSDLVLILFGGSGAEAAVCRQLDRRFITAEIDETYYKMILDRLKYAGAVPDKYRLATLMKRKERKAVFANSLFDADIGAPRFEQFIYSGQA